MKRRHFLRCSLGTVLLLAGCNASSAPDAPRSCPVVLERSEAFSADRYALSVPEGGRAVFRLLPADGYTLTGADDPDAELVRTSEGYTLTLPQVRYATAVSVTAVRSEVHLYSIPTAGSFFLAIRHRRGRKSR